MTTANDQPMSVIRFIVNGIEPKFVPEFMNGLNDRMAAYIAAPSEDAMTAVDGWITEWAMSAAQLKRRSFLTAAATEDDGTITTGADLRRRVLAKRAAVLV